MVTTATGLFSPLCLRRLVAWSFNSRRLGPSGLASRLVAPLLRTSLAPGGAGRSLGL